MNNLRQLVVGSRGSPLAMIQTQSVICHLQRSGLFRCTIQVISTSGDAKEDAALHLSEEQGWFTRALETALGNGEIDLAVHSLKDLPLQQPEGLALAAVPPRSDIGDCAVVTPNMYNHKHTSLPLYSGATVGTASPRRQAQIRSVRDDLLIEPITGNINTRLDKLENGEVDALILAAAGLKRLNVSASRFVIQPLDHSIFVPAPAQGALAVQMRSQDPDSQSVREVLNDPLTESCVNAERRLLELFGGGCSLPIGCLVIIERNRFRLYGYWSQGDRHYRAQTTEESLDRGVYKLYELLTDQNH